MLILIAYSHLIEFIILSYLIAFIGILILYVIVKGRRGVKLFYFLKIEAFF